MSAPENLADCYSGELMDLVSANDQMKVVVKKLAAKAGDSKLKSRLEKSIEGIQTHTDTVKELLKDLGETGKEHCVGMEGLCKEAEKHAIDEKIEDNDVRDVVIVAQYQRLCHYGICGFGTAKAFAEGLENKAHVAKLDKITADIYGADENMSELAEMCVNLQAKTKETA